MSVLFIKGSPRTHGNMTRLVARLPAGKTYGAIETGTTKVYACGQDFDEDRFEGVTWSMVAADTIVFGSPMYRHSFSGTCRTLTVRNHGPILGVSVGRRPFFSFQGGGPTREQPVTAEWTIGHFAGLCQMRHEGTVANAAEAVCV